jgi:hypothetical protein
MFSFNIIINFKGTHISGISAARNVTNDVIFELGVLYLCLRGFSRTGWRTKFDFGDRHYPQYYKRQNAISAKRSSLLFDFWENKYSIVSSSRMKVYVLYYNLLILPSKRAWKRINSIKTFMYHGLFIIYNSREYRMSKPDFSRIAASC